jgi:hypothetical protein
MKSSRQHRGLFLAIVPLIAVLASESHAQSLRGSRASINRMYNQAKLEKFTFLETTAGVRKFVASGLLVRLASTRNVTIHRVSFPYARPEVRTFVARLGAQYRSSCGESLVVTSAVRPASRQPYNSTERSVHPTGMAIDLRKPRKASCLRWLRNALVSLERSRVIEATEEHSPAHFHVAVFPSRYVQYVAARSAAGETRLTDD